MSARLKERYQKDIAPAIAKEFGIRNPMAIPRLEKIVINMGMGEAIANAKILDTAADELRSEAGDNQGEKIDRFLQVATGHAHWRDGDAAR
jgi:large subunit ribosomal protein L5